MHSVADCASMEAHFSYRKVQRDSLGSGRCRSGRCPGSTTGSGTTSTVQPTTLQLAGSMSHLGNDCLSHAWPTEFAVSGSPCRLAILVNILFFCVQPRPVLPAAEIRREPCCCRLHNYEYFPLFGSVSKTVTINRVG
jgi:hypothetical protein